MSHFKYSEILHKEIQGIQNFYSDVEI